MMSRGRTLFRIAFTSTLADSAAESAFSGSGEAICEEPSRLMPSASNEEDMVLAGYWPPQEPTEGPAYFSIPSKSSRQILAAARAPPPPKGEQVGSFFPFPNPRFMGPAYTKI